MIPHFLKRSTLLMLTVISLTAGGVVCLSADAPPNPIEQTMDQMRKRMGNNEYWYGTVTVTITAVNDAPVAVADVKTTLEDTPLTFPAADLVANDTDVDGDTLTVTAVTNGLKGTAVLTTGSITYTPTLNANGVDSFTYTISDGHGGTDTANVSVLVGKGQWASSVLGKSSAWTDGGPYDWYAAQALGSPNTLDYGDLHTAWAPSPEDGGTAEYLTVGFKTADYATGVLIR